MTEALRISGLGKAFGHVGVLSGIDLSVSPGETVAVMGPSGSGKTTLLLCAGGLLQPDAGQVLVDGQDLHALPRAQRARRVGFVFQRFHLLPYLDACANVRLGGCDELRAQALLDGLGLGHRRGHRPGQLSAGEQQRVAVARALAGGARVLLADEPTGNLDDSSADAVMRALLEAGATLVVATHDARVAGRLSRTLHLGTTPSPSADGGPSHPCRYGTGG